MAQNTIDPTIPAKASPLRLLILSPSVNKQKSLSPFPSFLEKLTGSLTSQDISTFAGYTSHPALHLKTRYYEANVTLWCDELPAEVSGGSEDAAPESQTSTSPVHEDAAGSSDQPVSSISAGTEPTPTLSEWREQMLSTSAREVRDVIGGIIVLFPHHQQGQTSVTIKALQVEQVERWIPYIEAVTALRDAIEDESGRDIASIVLLQDTSLIADDSSDALLSQTEDECLSTHGIIGWDFVYWRSAPQKVTLSNDTDPIIISTGDSKHVQARNEFGEKQGFPRVLEVLGAIDWTAGPSTTETDDDNDELEDLIGPDPLADLEPRTPTRTTLHPNKNNYTTVKDATRANLPTSSMTPKIEIDPESDVTDPNNPPLLQEHQEFQREMLGLKMAMLDLSKDNSGNSAPSSLAGEYDAGDFGARTPMPGLSEKAGSAAMQTAGTPSRLREVQTSGGALGDGGDRDGDEIQVQQLGDLMEQVKALREAAEGLDENEREKFARREVNRIMKRLK